MMQPRAIDGTAAMILDVLFRNTKKLIINVNHATFKIQICVYKFTLSLPQCKSLFNIMVKNKSAFLI